MQSPLPLILPLDPCPRVSPGRPPAAHRLVMRGVCLPAGPALPPPAVRNGVPPWVAPWGQSHVSLPLQAVLGPQHSTCPQWGRTPRVKMVQRSWAPKPRVSRCTWRGKVHSPWQSGGFLEEPTRAPGSEGCLSAQLARTRRAPGGHLQNRPLPVSRRGVPGGERPGHVRGQGAPAPGGVFRDGLGAKVLNHTSVGGGVGRQGTGLGHGGPGTLNVAAVASRGPDGQGPGL